MTATTMRASGSRLPGEQVCVRPERMSEPPPWLLEPPAWLLAQDAEREELFGGEIPAWAEPSDEDEFDAESWESHFRFATANHGDDGGAAPDGSATTGSNADANARAMSGPGHESGGVGYDTDFADWEQQVRSEHVAAIKREHMFDGLPPRSTGFAAKLLAESDPGPGLARLLADLDVSQLSDFELVEYVAATDRQASWVHAQQLNAIAELNERESMNPTWPYSAGNVVKRSVTGDEIAMRLKCSRRSAQKLVENAQALFAGPLIDAGSALEAGRLTVNGTRIILEHLSDVHHEEAQLVLNRVLPRAHSRTPWQLGADLARELARVAPDEVEKRVQDAKRGRRVDRPSPRPNGMAYWGVTAPAADLVMADTVLDHHARSLKKNGDQRTLDQLRADLFLSGILNPNACHHPQRAKSATEDKVRTNATTGDTATDTANPRADGEDTATDTANPRADGEDTATDTANLSTSAEGAAEDANDVRRDPTEQSDIAASNGPPAESALDEEITTACDHGTSGDHCATGNTEQADPEHQSARDRAVDDRNAAEHAANDRSTTDDRKASDDTDMGDFFGGLTSLPVRARINVTVPLSTLIGEGTEPGDLEGYGPIDAVTARALAKGGIWRRIVTDPVTQTVLNVGRTTYRPPTALADHVRARDKKCARPGCSVPASVADLDHTVEFHRHGGETSDANLGPLCERDHQIKTDGGHVLKQIRTGLFAWTTPTGHTYLIEPGRDSFATHLSDPDEQRPGEPKVRYRDRRKRNEAANAELSHALTHPEVGAKARGGHLPSIDDDPPF